MTTQYQLVTDRIIAMLEGGVRPWARPWNASDASQPAVLARPLRHDGTPYRGVNVLNLWAAGAVRGFAPVTWMTYKKASELGGQVRKGSRSEFAFYVGQTTKTEQDKNGEDCEKTISFLRAYCVFNVAEIDGLPQQYYGSTVPAPAPDVPRHARIAHVDAWIAGTGARIAHGGDRAFYMPSGDRIQMPALDAFCDAESYYSTTLHELTHWSGASHRLARVFGSKFGDPAYGAEELIAELGAAFLCADLRISNEPRADHAAYLASWLKALKADNRNIFRAASLAEKAAGYLHGLQAAPPVALAA
jgi:antirestriction protein ArdC